MEINNLIKKKEEIEKKLLDHSYPSIKELEDFFQSLDVNNWMFLKGEGYTLLKLLAPYISHLDQYQYKILRIIFKPEFPIELKWEIRDAILEPLFYKDDIRIWFEKNVWKKYLANKR